MLARLFDEADGGLLRPRWAAAAAPGQTPYAVGAVEIVSNRTRTALRDAWVAEEAGTVVGTVLAYRMVAQKIGTDQPYARLKAHVVGSWYVDSLAIVEGRRGAGLGRLLLQTAKEAARRAGCTTMSLLVYDTNAAAAALYARCGFLEAGAGSLTPDQPSGARSIRLLRCGIGEASEPAVERARAQGI
ncbi:GNAT family N-acetyltransferase [Roseobacter sp. HKCCA0434]|uniref:GNAT family N-acetyltransferase n=1 Tax=Roseobacter sp. HKCCA0434 TaxID=3079297 RepID=UPI002905CC7B|nr:GNAT family N-acetyltransferase [Roseobacter sp. HKCCA0434]